MKQNKIMLMEKRWFGLTGKAHESFIELAPTELIQNLHIFEGRVVIAYVNFQQNTYFLSPCINLRDNRQRNTLGTICSILWFLLIFLMFTEIFLIWDFCSILLK